MKVKRKAKFLKVENTICFYIWWDGVLLVLVNTKKWIALKKKKKKHVLAKIWGSPKQKCFSIFVLKRMWDWNSRFWMKACKVAMCKFGSGKEKNKRLRFRFDLVDMHPPSQKLKSKITF